MTTDPLRFRKLIDLVGDALERPADERDAFLRATCGADTALLAEARALLARNDDASPDAATAALRDRVVRIVADSTTVRAHPDRIGPFEVLEVLGQGGMGVVYGARQLEPIRRDVAIKLVRSGLGAPGLLARFEVERQTLARLDHPNIATVFDAGTTADGQPYLVMEWVHGEPITGYCATRHLGLDDRLRLFATVCMAVHHAHQKAVIHRDLKPSNVLVTEVDGEPVVKVIDFGIATMVATDDSGDTAHTAQGTVLGTLEYMSPEQAAWSGAEVDVRSDVYSLGTMLYELLTGTLPFPSETLRRASPVDVQRLLRETDPPTPSRRLAMVPPPDGRPVPSLRLRTEIDWVVMTALEKDPDRRYQSAHMLAADLEHLLRHEPVTAAPPGLRYRVGKLIRRHRVVTTAALVTTMALVGGGIAATIGFVQASRARDDALIEARKAAAVSGFLTGMFAEVEPDHARGDVVTVIGVLDSAAARLEHDDPFRDEPDVEATIRFAIGNSYREMGEYRAALPMLTRALAIWRRILPPDDNRIAQAISGIGNAHWRRGDLDSARVYAESLLAFRERTISRTDPRYSQAVHILGNAYADLGRSTVAESLYRVAVGLDSQAVRTARGEPLDSARDNLGTSLNNLGTVLVDERRYAEAVTVFETSLAFRRTFLAPDSPQIGGLLSNLGHAMMMNGDLAAAIDTLERAAALNERVYGPTHVTTASTWRRLGDAYRRVGRLDEAARLLDRARATYELRTGPTSYRVGQVLVPRGEVRVARGDVAAGFAEMEHGWTMLRDGLGADHPFTRAAAAEIAGQLAARGDSGRAAMWRTRSGS